MSNIPVYRRWQESAIFMIQSKWDNDPSEKILIAACPGSGKTFMAASVALDKIKSGEVNLVIVISPTVNIKAQWKDQFKRFNIEAIDDVTNEAMRFRKLNGERLVGNYLVICVTYSQLAKDRELFAELSKREGKVLVIADEVHHADDDESFGLALEMLSDSATYRLSLSGTPFNSTGGALAMCPWEETTTDEGRIVRRAKPLYNYDYGNAIADESCRPVEFVTIGGKGTQTYRRLSNDEVWEKVIDLANQKKNDSLGALLNVNGEFLESLMAEGLKSLTLIKKHDQFAGMLIVAKDKDHGSQISGLIADLCSKNQEWRHYQTTEIYHDTPKAHDKIRMLERDRTDIIVTVRMISEGVDIKRLRVGVFATDYRTRMFFIQFIGRFVRWETRLDETQYSRVIIPAHVMLLNYAREIERMVEEAEIKKDDDGGGEAPTKKNELIGVSTEKTGDGLVYRGKVSKERLLANKFFSIYPSLLGKIPEYAAIVAAKEGNIDGAVINEQPEEEIDWWKKNSKLVAAIVRRMRVNGEDDSIYYGKVNREANKHVGIKRVDKLVPVETMKKRCEFLRRKLTLINKGVGFDDEL